MTANVRVQIFPEGVREVALHPDMARLLTRTANATVVARARQLAPHRTGAGAASIATSRDADAESVYVDVSWDARHDYMRFQDLGTKYVTGKHFLEQALQESAT